MGHRNYYKQHGGQTGFRAFIRRNRKNILPLAALLLFAGIFIFSLIQVISYFADYFSAKDASSELREIYYAQEEETPLPSPEPTALPTPAPTQQAASLPLAVPTPAPAPTIPVYLPEQRYPTNYYATVSSRFQKLQRQNPDIIGWLTLPDLLDEAVVQRDNSYYLRRDYRGYHNTNGAIFLEENCSLKTRPYTLILYGHNMKTGAMFGCLRNYENLAFYKKNPFITFDTAYEKGRYVIFSITTASLKSYDRNFLNFGKLHSSNTIWRQEAISFLRQNSLHYSFIDVQPQDQLLVLVTCVDDDTERRLLAARRIREDETEAMLQQQIQSSFSR